mmetsp:Transcript_18791/g.51451  ORF Transcript_18791/g.51451 Transcript_18791/m.51451 type:complete len:228 (+) Transcript_18791:2-685(+)
MDNGSGGPQSGMMDETWRVCFVFFFLFFVFVASLFLVFPFFVLPRQFTLCHVRPKPRAARGVTFVGLPSLFLLWVSRSSYQSKSNNKQQQQQPHIYPPNWLLGLLLLLFGGTPPTTIEPIYRSIRSSSSQEPPFGVNDRNFVLVKNTASNRSLQARPRSRIDKIPSGASTGHLDHHIDKLLPPTTPDARPRLVSTASTSTLSGYFLGIVHPFRLEPRPSSLRTAHCH